jgi:NAD-dependent SIR2 family protein deacetylase
MSETRYSHSLSLQELFTLLLFQANQFEMFKNFVIEILDSRNVIQQNDFHELFDEYKKMNTTKQLHNLIMLHPELEDMKIDIALIR